MTAIMRQALNDPRQCAVGNRVDFCGKIDNLRMKIKSAPTEALL